SRSPLDRSLLRPKTDLPLATFSLLLSEMIKYSNGRSRTVQELQSKLADFGRHIGSRSLDLLFFRERNGRRELRLKNALFLVKSSLWRMLFGKDCDDLEQSTDDERTFYFVEREPVTNRFVSFSQKADTNVNCAAFIGGVLEGALCSAGFQCQVATFFSNDVTYYEVKFEPSVLTRDRSLDSR
ncbi:hypothetical protein BOX15_Mlig019976g2, partial [Macrostomum lignano]